MELKTFDVVTSTLWLHRRHTAACPTATPRPFLKHKAVGARS